MKERINCFVVYKKGRKKIKIRSGRKVKMVMNEKEKKILKTYLIILKSF